MDKVLELLNYPQIRWEESACERWRWLSKAINYYEQPRRITALDKERKWELVSAFQKSIRRGNKATALRLVAMMESMPEEYPYFWRRLCVIACEDVGPADDTLTAFVVACNTVFPPKQTVSDNYRLICFLAEQICDLAHRSRIYCGFSAIEPAALKGDLPELTTEEQSIITTILQRRAAVQSGENLWRAWQKKNDWRGEGMLKFVGLRLPFDMILNPLAMPPSTNLFDLPSYSFDMHTRVGLKVLQRLVRGVCGAEDIREFFRENRIKNAHRALGEVLFCVEGGRIEQELRYDPLCLLEQRVFAYQYGVSFPRWCDLHVFVQKALRDGVVDRVREEVLMQFYGQRNLQLIAKPTDHEVCN